MTETEDPADSRYRAPALDKGLDILEILAGQSEGMTRADLVRAMGRSPSEIYRMLERLVVRGYVARTEGGDRYSLTMKLFLLATRHPPQRRLVTAAQPLMDEFARATGQSCHLVVPERRRAVVIAHAMPEATWEFRVRVGAELDLFETSSVLTLLAFQQAAGDASALGSWGMGEADLARLRAIEPHLAAIRAAGYRQGPSAQMSGVTDLSAPIFGLDRSAVAVLTSAFIHHPGEAPRDLDSASARLCGIAAALSFEG